MPRGFKGAEKENISKRLIAEGTRLFEHYGLKKTSIEEIVKAAGIAKGSFYKFFPSKEVLYFTCLEAQETKFQEKHLHPLMTSTTNSTEMLTTLFALIFKLPEEYPLIALTLNKDQYAALLRGLPEETLASHRDTDKREMMEFMTVWKNCGLEINEDPAVLNGLFQALVLLNLHRPEIGDDLFNPVMKLLGDIMTEGMKSLFGSEKTDD